jgi:hypothetical protein
MKKRIMILALASLTISMCSCTMEINLNGSSYSASTETSISDKKEEKSDKKNEVSAEKDTDKKQNTNKKDESSSKADKKEEETTTKPTEKTTESEKIESPFDESDYPSISLGTGGVEINSDIDEKSDKELISVATDLYKRACETEWSYHVGSPYKLDYSTTVEGNFGWEYSLVDDPSITTLDDVIEDYYKVFSHAYGNDLDELYIEKNGSVYALAGDRGSDIFYEGFRITEVSRKTESEIFFTVENYYDDSSDDPHIEPVVEGTFSIVKNGNSWRVGKFKLPY